MDRNPYGRYEHIDGNAYKTIGQMTFNSSDAWLLEAIKFSEGNNGATLRDIIATADYINHAIMTYSEFDSGTKKLLTCGLINKQGKQLETTGKFRNWWKAKFKNQKRIRVLKTMEEIEKYLNRNFGIVEAQTNQDNPFTNDDFDKAATDYLEFSQSTLDKITKKELR